MSYRAEPPVPPPGLGAIGPNDWVQVWRRVLAQPRVAIEAWDRGDPVIVTAAVKAVGLAGCTFADFTTGTRIYPGNEILGNVAGVSEKTAAMAVTVICRLGLWWRYVDGSSQGRRAVSSEYRLTLPDDLIDRVPLLTPNFKVPKSPVYHRNSDHLISDHLISASGTPELSARINGTEFPPTRQEHFITQTAINGPVVTGSCGRQDRASDQDHQMERIGA